MFWPSEHVISNYCDPGCSLLSASCKIPKLEDQGLYQVCFPKWVAFTTALDSSLAPM